MINIILAIIIAVSSINITTVKAEGIVEDIASDLVEAVVETTAIQLLNYMRYRYPVAENFRQEVLIKVMQKEVTNYIRSDMNEAKT